MERLNPASPLPAAVRQPGYHPAAHTIGIVHFGIGAFHRAHMAVYTDDVLAADGGNWRICGVSLRSAEVRDRLMPQNCRYTLVERDQNGDNLRLIASVSEVLVAPENPETVLQRLTEPQIQIISLTITEKGYLRDPASGALLQQHPDIQHDLVNPQTPRTVHGFITEALARRRRLQLPPPTLLCCDNLPENGHSLRSVINEFARLRDPDLAHWIEATIAFPCTMVDRIVPATTEADIASTAEKLDCRDQAPVVCEPFSQWVIEDRFCAARPAWEKFGVLFVKDVAPYEEMKLRLLNGAHSAMAYLGYLGGFDYINQVVSHPAYLAFIRELMKESRATLRMPAGVDLDAYCAALIQRFRNPALKHRTWQIAMDGSLKIPQRLLNPIRARIAANQPYPHLAMAVAGWLRYITGIDEKGNPIEVSDPYAARLRLMADQHHRQLKNYVRTVLQMKEIFGADLAVDKGFFKVMNSAMEKLCIHGARKAITLETVSKQ